MHATPKNSMRLIGETSRLWNIERESQ